MPTPKLKNRMLAGEILVTTFLKTPSHQIVEVLADSQLDFLTLDAEHAPFDRAGTDACMAVARALGMPVLVRLVSGNPADILQALDAGATGVVVPHVDSVEKARAIARAGHFGHGGRGYAGATRWAGYGRRPMAEVLRQDGETIVIAQIEEPEGVELAEEIAAVEGIDGLFVGPADLAVCYGAPNMDAPEVREAMARTGRAAARHGKAFMTFTEGPQSGADLHALGVRIFFVASEHAFMLAGANAAARQLRDLA